MLGKHRSTRLEVPTLMLNETEDFALSAGDLGGYEPYADDLRVHPRSAHGFSPRIAVRFVSALMEPRSANTGGRVPLSEASRGARMSTAER